MSMKQETGARNFVFGAKADGSAGLTRLVDDQSKITDTSGFVAGVEGQSIEQGQTLAPEAPASTHTPADPTPGLMG